MLCNILYFSSNNLFLICSLYSRLAPLDSPLRTSPKLPPIHPSQLTTEDDGSPTVKGRKKPRKTRTHRTDQTDGEVASKDHGELNKAYTEDAKSRSKVRTEEPEVKVKPRSKVRADEDFDSGSEGGDGVKKVLPRSLPSPKGGAPDVGVSTSVTEPLRLHSNYATHSHRMGALPPLVNRPPSIEYTQAPRPLPGRRETL